MGGICPILENYSCNLKIAKRKRFKKFHLGVTSPVLGMGPSNGSKALLQLPGGCPPVSASPWHCPVCLTCISMPDVLRHHFAESRRHIPHRFPLNGENSGAGGSRRSQLSKRHVTSSPTPIPTCQAAHGECFLPRISR